MDKGYGTVAIEDICRYLISHEDSWIDESTPKDEDEWADYIFEQAELFVRWEKKIDSETYSAALYGWHGIYFFADIEFDPIGFFLTPESADGNIHEHLDYGDDPDVTVTETFRKPFVYLTAEQQSRVREKSEGPYLSRVLSPQSLSALAARASREQEVSYKNLSEEAWQEVVADYLKESKPYRMNYASGMAYRHSRQKYAKSFGRSVPRVYDTMPDHVAFDLVCLALKNQRPLPETLGQFVRKELENSDARSVALMSKEPVNDSNAPRSAKADIDCGQNGENALSNYSLGEACSGYVLVCFGDEQPTEFIDWLVAPIAEFQALNDHAEDIEVSLSCRDLVGFLEAIGVSLERSTHEMACCAGGFYTGWVKEGEVETVIAAAQHIIKVLQEELEDIDSSYFFDKIDSLKDQLAQEKAENCELQKDIRRLKKELEEADEDQQQDRSEMLMKFLLSDFASQEPMFFGPFVSIDLHVFVVVDEGGVQLPKGLYRSLLDLLRFRSTMKVIEIKEQRTEVLSPLSGRTGIFRPQTEQDWQSLWKSSGAYIRERCFTAVLQENQAIFESYSDRILSKLP